MKQTLLLIFSSVIVLSYFSCDQEANITDPLDGNYNGFLITSREIFENEIFSQMTMDTFPISVSIENLEFERPGPRQNLNCTGQVDVDGGNILFSSEECSCHCDCHPLIDCAGDLILGQFEYELEMDSLSMFSTFESTMSYSLNQCTSPDSVHYRYVYDWQYKLVRD